MATREGTKGNQLLSIKVTPLGKELEMRHRASSEREPKKMQQLRNEIIAEQLNHNKVARKKEETSGQDEKAIKPNGTKTTMS